MNVKKKKSKDPTKGRTTDIPDALESTSPALSSFAAPHLNMFVSKKIFNKCSINSGHACMMNSKAIGQKILQLQVL